MNDTNDWRARAEAAEARLADLTAPAEGVDVEEVLRLDREATEGPWTMIIGNQGRGALAHVETDGETEAGVTICSINKRAQGGKGETNADLIAFYRSAAPALARALIAARADLSALRSLDQPVASALCRRAQVRLLASIGAPMSRRETPARLGLALLLLDGSAADVQTYLRAVEPCLDQRARSGLLAMLLRAAALGRSGRRATVEEVIRA